MEPTSRLTKTSKSEIDGDWLDANYGGDLLIMSRIKLEAHEKTWERRRSTMHFGCEVQDEGNTFGRVL